jgi:hypothetical protein
VRGLGTNTTGQGESNGRTAHLLDAVPDGLELIGKVLAASVGPASPKRNVRSARGVQQLKG